MNFEPLGRPVLALARKVAMVKKIKEIHICSFNPRIKIPFKRICDLGFKKRKKTSTTTHNTIICLRFKIPDMLDFVFIFDLLFQHYSPSTDYFRT